MSDLRKTPLYNHHTALDAKIVDFGGWALPVNYGSQIDEHNAVRNNCGIFDVSHMTVSDVTGPETVAYLRYLLANDLAKVSNTSGKAMYSCMLTEDGGVIDDLIVYYLNDEHCRVVTNASTNEKDMAWMQKQAANFDITFTERPELAIIAVQGPNAIKLTTDTLAAEQAAKISALSRFQGCFYSDDEFVGRTGYTGEDGLEFIISADTARNLWDALVTAGATPAGLGARDTLRLEAGMSLYGNDLDEDHSPLESGLAWSVAMKDDRNFIGKTALQEDQRFKMIGLILLDRGVLRSHQTVQLNGNDIGETTSGTFSPTLEQSIAIARVNKDAELTIGDEVQIAVRNRQLAAKVARYPFVKEGKATN